MESLFLDDRAIAFVTSGSIQWSGRNLLAVLDIQMWLLQDLSKTSEAPEDQEKNPEYFKQSDLITVAQIIKDTYLPNFH